MCLLICQTALPPSNPLIVSPLSMQTFLRPFSSALLPPDLPTLRAFVPLLPSPLPPSLRIPSLSPLPAFRCFHSSISGFPNSAFRVCLTHSLVFLAQSSGFSSPRSRIPVHEGSRRPPPRQSDSDIYVTCLYFVCTVFTTIVFDDSAPSARCIESCIMYRIAKRSTPSAPLLWPHRPHRRRPWCAHQHLCWLF